MLFLVFCGLQFGKPVPVAKCFGLANQSCCYIIISRVWKEVGVTNQGPNTNSVLISRMEMRLCTQVTRGLSRELLLTIYMVNFTLNI